MSFVGIEDLTGRIEVLVFGKVVERVGDLLEEDRVIMMDVRLSERQGSVRALAEDVRMVSPNTLVEHARVVATHKRYITETPKEFPSQKKVIIEFGKGAEPKLIEELSKILRALPRGDSGVDVKLLGSTIHTTFRIPDDSDTLLQLKEVPGVENVRV